MTSSNSLALMRFLPSASSFELLELATISATAPISGVHLAGTVLLEAVAIGGVVCIAGAAVFGLRLPALRAQARELIVAQQMAGGEPAEEVTGGPLTPVGRIS